MPDDEPESELGRMISHDSTTTVTPDSPALASTELPQVEEQRRERVDDPSRRRDDGDDQESLQSTSSNNNDASSPPSSSSSSAASSSSPTSSPAKGGAQGGGGGGGANHPPSRRVKVYKLKDDAWVDLGTGTCRGVLNHQRSPPGDMEEVGKLREKVDPDQEGAWIVVKREKPASAASSGSSSPKVETKDGDDDDKDRETRRRSGGGGGENGNAQEGEDEDEEDDEKDIILRTRVQPYPPGFSEDFEDEELVEAGEDGQGQTLDVGGYQRQQDTLIVWTERTVNPDSHVDDETEMALSFATSTGCQEMWEFIKAARRFTAEQAMLLLSPSPSPSLSSPRSFPMHASFNPSASLSTQLPQPTLATVPQLEHAIRTLSRTAVARERTAIQIVKSGFIEKLIEVHHEAEDLESLSDLHALCRVMQTILLLNDNSIFELVLKDELILGVVGILEYDPDFPSMKASYKSHLSNPDSFISIVPIESPSLLSKIHQTHRLHYLKDVILARILEDSTFSMLNSAIYFNEVEIVNEVVGGGGGGGGGGGSTGPASRDKGLIEKVFKILNEEEEDDDDDDDDDHEGRPGRDRESSLKGMTDEPRPSRQGKGKEEEKGEHAFADDDEAPRAVKKRKLDDSRSTTKRRSDEGTAGLGTVRDSADEVARSRSSSSLRKPRAIQFLSQLTHMAKNLQLPLRTSMYRTLVDKGLLTALERALAFANESGDVALRARVIQVWMGVVDLDAKDVRAYCLEQSKRIDKDDGDVDDDNETAAEAAAAIGSDETERERMTTTRRRRRRQSMLAGLIETFKVEEDLGIKTHLAEALRVLLDAAGESGPLEAPPRLRAPEDPEAEKFLQYFYDHYILSLLQPLIDLLDRKDSDPPLELPPAWTALLSHLCDLLCFFIAHHSFRSKYLILSSPQLARAVSHLVRPRPRLTRHTHLRLAALRFFRACVARNDDFYNRFLVKHDLVRCVVETAVAEQDKDNLLGSACLEFFEYIRSTNAKGLINHVMDRCGEQIRQLATKFKTFEGLVARWAINNEPPPPPPTSSSSTAANSTSKNGDESIGSENGSGAKSEAMQRQTSKPGWAASSRMDVEEESYFNTDDDEEPEPEPEPGTTSSDAGPGTAPTSAGARNAESTPTTSTHFGSSRRKREPTSNPSLAPSSASADDRGREANGTALASTESKRVKLDDEASDSTGDRGANRAGSSSLPRSQTWPQGGTTASGTGLVDYMDDEEEDEKGGESAVARPGGFIRDGDADSDDDDASVAVAKPDAPAPLPLPLPGALKRKQEEEDEDEGLGGLLRSKGSSSTTSAAPFAGKRKPDPSSSSHSHSHKPKSKPLGPTMTTTTAAAAGGGGGGATKPGRFKIAFGSSLRKSTPASTSSASPSKSKGPYEDAVEKRLEGGGGGFGKFGAIRAGSPTTEPGQSGADKG